MKKVLPDGIKYFYGYPGKAIDDNKESKKFYNNVPFETVERKVASRVGKLGCEYINFASNGDYITSKIYNLFGFYTDKQTFFSDEIEDFSSLLEKDKKIKKYIIKNFSDGEILQAQPYTEKKVIDKYALPSQHAINLNDKLFMNNWIPSKFLGERSNKPFDEFPFMAKLSRSSAGDATFKINNPKELTNFLGKFQNISKEIPLFYEKMVDGKEYGIEFYRTYEGERGIIKIIDSMVNDDNSYMGGLINRHIPKVEQFAELMDSVFKYLDSINWYGRGGIDVLVSGSGKVIVIDPNVRVTQIMGAAWDSYINKYDKDMFYKSFTLSTEKDILRTLEDAIKNDLFKGYSATIHGGKLYGDLGILFDNKESLNENINDLKKMGFSI